MSLYVTRRSFEELRPFEAFSLQKLFLVFVLFGWEMNWRTLWDCWI